MPTDALFLVFDLAIRGGDCLLLALIVAILLRDLPGRIEALLGAMLAVSIAGFAVWSGPDLGLRDSPLMTPVLIFSVGNGLVFWLFSRSVFEEHFRLRFWHLAAWLGIAGTGLAAEYYALHGDIDLASTLARALAAQSLGFAILAAGQAIGSWNGDLVETRRRFRVMVVPAAVTFASLNITTEALDSLGDRGLLASLAEAIVLATLSFAAAWSLLEVRGAERLLGPAKGAPPSAAITGEDQTLLNDIEQTMSFERLYRQQDLTLRHLATSYDVTEANLRELIWRGTGYRSYGGFLDKFRVEEVKAALADPHQDEVPRLTIARDAGFASLRRLNRAFWVETGMSPKAFQSARNILMMTG